MINDLSKRPYLLRAIYEWCVAQRFTPFIVVIVDEHTVVPPKHVRDGEIVLNIAPEAVHGLLMGDERITFSARFGGVSRDLSIPVSRVAAIYALENGEGLAFTVESLSAQNNDERGSEVPGGLQVVQSSTDDDPKDPDPPQKQRPRLVRVK